MQLGLGTILFVVFLVLKLMHIIDWSWWWITAPLWISFILTLFMVVLMAYANAKTPRHLRK